MSANSVSLSNNILNYDFTTSDTSYYGTNGAKEIESGVWGTIAGDGNTDGGIYAEDYTLYRISQGNEGYIQEDYNLDGGAYSEDYTIYKLNQGMEASIR